MSDSKTARQLILPAPSGAITVTFPAELTALDLQVLQEALTVMQRWIIVPQKAGADPEGLAPHPATRSARSDEGSPVAQTTDIYKP